MAASLGVCVCVCVCVCVWVAWSCLTLWDPMDCSSPGSSVHGILQGRKLEWVAIPFSRGSSPPRDQTQVSCIAGRFFTIWTTEEAHYVLHLVAYICQSCSPSLSNPPLPPLRPHLCSVCLHFSSCPANRFICKQGYIFSKRARFLIRSSEEKQSG